MADVDDHGRPKPPIQGFPEPSPEVEIRRRAAVEEHGTGGSVFRPPRKGVPFTSHMSQEEFDAFDYPKVPEEWTEEWMANQIEKERVDPRENPNLLLDENHQEFWDNLSRKPYAKKILRTEQHWVDRKKVWLKQYGQVESMNQLRSEVSELLEDCSMEVKRLVTPIMHHKICEVALWNCWREAEDRGVPFQQVVEGAEKLRDFQGMRRQIDAGGDPAAARLMDEFSARAAAVVGDRVKDQTEARRGCRIEADTDTVTKCLNMGQKLRKDGYIEWHKGNVDEALASWREANEYLKKFRLPESDIRGNTMLSELHATILKNIAQAAIRLESWTEALEAADDALAIDDEDHKAWFRRACALEGLGRLEEEEAALARIDDLVVGRPDRERLLRDLAGRRGRLRELQERGAELERRSLGRALARGVFSDLRSVDGLLDDPSASCGSSALPCTPPAARLPGPRALGDDSARADAAGAGVSEAGDQAPESTGAWQRTEEFRATDIVVVREALADLLPGQRGAVLEVDEDGDVRIRFEGQDEEELIFRMDFGSLALDPSLPPAPATLPAEGRKGLTRDGAAAVLDAQIEAFADGSFRRRVAKLMRDVRWNRLAFLRHLQKVALEAQESILTRWGFEATARGVVEMQLAVQDHTVGDHGDAALQTKSSEVAALLFGEMRTVVFPGPPACSDGRPVVGPLPAQDWRPEVVYGVG